MKKVLVMLSSYNGEQYIREQIDSIFKQENVSIDLFVRDDGSTDNTVKVLKEYPKKIDIEVGENIGWKRSFMSMLYTVTQDYDYYAFADQDDVWLTNKIYTAINKIHSEDLPCLYYSMMTQVDDNLEVMAEQQSLHYPIEKPMVLFQNFVQGSTIVFNRKLLQAAQKYIIQDPVPHDIWLPILATYIGKVVFDESSYILYRIHSNNVTVGMKNKYWKNLIKSVFSKELVENYAKYLMAGYREELSVEDFKCVCDIADYRKHKMSLLFNKDIKKISFKGTVMLKMAIILGRVK